MSSSPSSRPVDESRIFLEGGFESEPLFFCPFPLIALCCCFSNRRSLDDDDDDDADSIGAERAGVEDVLGLGRLFDEEDDRFDSSCDDSGSGFSLI